MTYRTTSEEQKKFIAAVPGQSSFLPDVFNWTPLIANCTIYLGTFDTAVHWHDVTAASPCNPGWLCTICTFKALCYFWALCIKDLVCRALNLNWHLHQITLKFVLHCISTLLCIEICFTFCCITLY